VRWHDDTFLVTCEHGGNLVPPEYAGRFAGWKRRLASHRGYDAGALWMAEDLARALSARLVASRVTRLLVDLNRSIGHRNLHSEAVRGAPRAEIERILRDHYWPYRRRVEGFVARAAARGRRLIHISSHSFTPRLDGVVRRADVGLLYDPARAGERALCGVWKSNLARLGPKLRVYRNYPYEGKNDGLTTHLRKRYPARVYLGVELEINQAILAGEGSRWAHLRATVIEALLSSTGGQGPAQSSRVVRPPQPLHRW
jgi:predicted N-formylglutamate amidohydrolase